jgi:hypothetical protein
MAFTFSRSVTINPALCGTAPSSNYPVLFSGTYGFLATVANGGYVTNSNGWDICFFADAALTTPLPFEIDNYSPTGACSFWVQVPTLSITPGSPTVFYLAYGNAAIITNQSTPASVWDSNFASIYHMSQVPTGTPPEILDSTSHALNLTSGTAGSGSISQVAGKIGNAVFTQAVSATQGGKLFSSANSGLSTTASFTISGWFLFKAFGSYSSGYTRAGQSGLTFNTLVGSSSTSTVRCLCIDNTQAAFGYIGTNSTSHFTPQSPAMSTNVWYFLTLTSDGTTCLLYQNGVNVGTIAAPGSGSYVDAPLYIEDAAAAGVNYTSCYNDEVRTSRIARTSSWITADYNNQSSPSTFYSFGAVSYTSTLNATTATCSASVTKGITKTLSSTTATCSATLSKTITKQLTAVTATCSATISKLISKMMNAATSTCAAVLNKTISKTIAAVTSPFAVTLQKLIEKTMNAMTDACTAMVNILDVQPQPSMINYVNPLPTIDYIPTIQKYPVDVITVPVSFTKYLQTTELPDTLISCGWEIPSDLTAEFTTFESTGLATCNIAGGSVASSPYQCSVVGATLMGRIREFQFIIEVVAG